MDKQMHWTYIFIIAALLTIAFPVIGTVLSYLWNFAWLVIVPAAVLFVLWYEKTRKE